MTVNFCKQCGNQLDTTSRFCPGCGTQIDSTSNPTPPAQTTTAPEEKSPKSAITALLLCLFFGAFGVHRFYVGKIGTGILMLITAGGFGIWTLVDLILIACCEFKDKEGKTLMFEKGRGSPVKIVLTVIGSLIVVFFVYIILLICFVLYFTSGLTGVIQDQISALRAGDLNKAYYSYTSKDFQDSTSLLDFKKFINIVPELKNNKSASFTDREFKNNEGTVKGTIESNDGATISIEYHLVKENNEWKILSIDVPAKSDQHKDDSQEKSE